MDHFCIDTNSLSIDNYMHYRDTVYLVYNFLSKTQKKVFVSFISSTTHVDSARELKMNYETYKSHLKNILEVFKYYGHNNKLPETTCGYIKKYVR